MTDEIRDLLLQLEAWWDVQCPLAMAVCGDCREAVRDCKCHQGEA